jgi:cytochrome c biogenesis protein CcdA
MEHLGTWLAQGRAMSLLAVAAVALAGLLVGLAPSSLPLYSVVAGYVGGQAARRTRGLLQVAGFFLGMATVDAALGALFGFLGFAVLRAVAGALALTDLLLAALLLVLGLALLRKIRIVVPVLRPKPRQATSFAAAYALGVSFGLSACPASPTCGPPDFKEASRITSNPMPSNAPAIFMRNPCESPLSVQPRRGTTF